MTVPVSIDHYKWVRDRLKAITVAHPTWTLFEGEVDPTPQLGSDDKALAYGVLYWTPPELWAPHLCGHTTNLTGVFQVTIAAGDQQRVALATGWVDQALIDVTPSVSGRDCARIKLGPTTGPVRWDPPGVTPRRAFSPRLYRISSQPA